MNAKAKMTIETLKALTERVEKATVIDEEEGEKYRVAGRLESLRVDAEALLTSASGDALIAGLSSVLTVLDDVTLEVEDLIGYADDENDRNEISAIVDDLYDAYEKIEELIEEACE